MAELESVAELVSGAGFPLNLQSQTGFTFPFFKVGNLKDVASGKPLVSSEHTISERAAYSLRARIIPEEATVFAKIGMAISLNRRRLIGRPACIDNNMMAAIPNEAIHPSYLLRFLETVDFMPLTQATTVPSLRKGNIAKILVPLAPLEEQRRIVVKLEKLLEKVESSRTRLEKIPVVLKRFRQSVLAAACSGRLTADWREQSKQSIEHIIRDNNTALPEIPESWRWVKLPDTGEMSRGKSRHRPRNEPSLFDGQYPFIQTGDIAQSGGRITSHKQTYNEAGLAQSRLWPANTICITIAANIAESAILTYPACFPDSIVGIIANSVVCLAEYVEFFIRVAKTDLSTFAPATAQKNINIAILNEVAVPLPPLIEQHEIVRRVEELFALADQIEARYQKAKAHVDKLTQSILAKAFRGELVPQDPNDTPAIILLSEIDIGKKYFKNTLLKRSKMREKHKIKTREGTHGGE
ncbi:MAG: restriction endonuclease subunit S [Deltaproteobacteria bacterium]|nr:restriction endonuclease subunit S [Deltaproteobacteria bacterium]